MKLFNLTLTLAAIFFITASAVSLKAQTMFGRRLLTVNYNGDSNDLNVGDGLCLDADGRCTLRAAIQESNSAGFDVVNFTLPASAVIELTMRELLITKPIQIIGPGGRNLTVQRTTNPDAIPFRVFHIAPNTGSNIVIRGLKVRNGFGDIGGGFYVETGNTVFLTDVTVSNNSASGGAIANAGTVILTRSLLNSNFSLNGSGTGGGFLNIGSNSAATISNSTLTDNRATNGGAVYNNGILSLVNNTISGNIAGTLGSSIVSAAGGTVNVLNTIIGIDTASNVTSLSGAFNSLGNNIVTDARNSTGFTNAVNSDQVSDNNAINPLLGSLADNGGQTDTRALLSGSPAINRGSNCVVNGSCPAPFNNTLRLSSDQRTNYTRLSGAAVDVGAFEAGNTIISGVVGFGTFASRPRLAGSIAILTNARTGEKIYSAVNPFGNFSFNNLPLEVYILEVKSKRAGLSSIAVFAFDNFPIPFPVRPAFLFDNYQLIERQQDKLIN